MSFQRKFRDKDLLNLAGTYLYAQEKGKNFDISLAEFPGSAEAEKEYLYRYGHQIPHRTSQLNLTAAYFHWWKEDWVLTPKYTVDIVAGKGNFQLYDLHRLPGFSWEHAPSLGTLPLEELTDVRNDQNSYHQRAVDGTHTLDWTLKWQKGRWFVQLNTPVRYVHRKMTYRRGEFDDTFVRRYCFFEPAVDAYYRWGKSVERKLEFTYAWQHDLPEMTDFVEEVNDLHPLEHYLGNTFLKSGTSHALALSFQRNRKDVNCSFGTTFETLFCPRGLGELTCFDYQKGVTSYKKYNTYGTYWLGNTTAFSSPLGNKYSPWRLKNESTVQYVHGTDYTQENRETAVERDVVHTLWLADNLSLHFHRADWRTFVTVGGEWNRASSGRPNFTSINVGSLHYGLSLTTPRFWGIQLSTDLTKYNRYGYEFSSKKKELVWNVRVSRDFGKNLLVYFDGFDLLHRLSGIYHSISAQGRVETVCHTIPRYAMLHVVYKFYHSTK